MTGYTIFGIARARDTRDGSCGNREVALCWVETREESDVAIGMLRDMHGLRFVSYAVRPLGQCEVTW